MAISIVQSGIGTDPGGTGTGSTFSPAFGSNNTAGNLLFFWIGVYGPTLSTFGDSQSNTWQSVPNDHIQSGNNLYARACLSCKGGANTISGSTSTAGFFDFSFAEITAGSGYVWNVDGGPFNSATGTGNTATSPSITTTGYNTILIAWMATGTSQEPAAPSGWTLLNRTSYADNFYYKVVTSPGTYNFSVGITSDSWQAEIWAFSTLGQTYYVAASGSDSNTGLSPASAWQSIAHVNAHGFVPNDTILFNGGDTFNGGVSLTASGASGNPITFGSYGTGNATINNSGAGTGGFAATNCGYITVQNLNFTGPGIATANKDGVAFLVNTASTTLNTIAITGLSVTGYAQGISVTTTVASSGYNGVTIKNCTCFNNNNTGIIVLGIDNTHQHANVYIGYCSSYGNTGVAGQPNWTGSGIFIGSANGGTIEYSIAHNNGAASNSPGGPVGIWEALSNNVTIQYCESYNNSSATVDGDGFDIDGGSTNCIIQYCYSHGNKGGAFCMFEYTGAGTFSGNTVRYCISENDGTGLTLWSQDVGDQITNSQMYNCTVYNSVGPSMQINAGGNNMTGITLSNNIFFTAGTQYLVLVTGTTVPGLTFQYNDYYSSGTWQISWLGTVYTSLATWGHDTTHGVVSNPLLTNAGGGGTIGNALGLTTGLTAYKILKTSPMIGAGVLLASPGARDFYGNPLFYNNQVDIGAHEFTPSVTGVSNSLIGGGYNFWGGGFNFFDPD